MISKTIKINKLGNLWGATGGSFAGNIYGVNGLAPTVNTAGGGYREPMILEVYETNDSLPARIF